MQEPRWQDVFAYILNAVRNGEWPIATWIAFALCIAVIRIAASWAWRRHRERQQLATIRFILARWADALGQPFWTQSTASQLDGVERLRGMFVGNREMVLALLIGLRVQLEVVPVNETVLEALDRVAAEWEDKLSSARRRRYRRLRELERERAASLHRRRAP